MDGHAVKDAGSAAVLVACLGVLSMTALAAAGPALTAGVRHRAQGIADAAALAGAVAQGNGLDPCAAAAAVVHESRAGRASVVPTLTSCAVVGEAVVDVDVELPWPAGGAVSLVGRVAPVAAHGRARVDVVLPG